MQQASYWFSSRPTINITFSFTNNHSPYQQFVKFYVKKVCICSIIHLRKLNEQSLLIKVYVKIHVKKICKGFFFEKKSICEVFINLKDNEKPIFNNYNRRYSINHTQHYIKYPKQQSYTLLDIHHYIQLINYNPNQSYNYTIKA